MESLSNFLMKKFIFLCSLVFMTLLGQSQELTTFVLVRHSEKANDGTRNPPLNELGKVRSQNLADLLNNQQVSALYATPFKRTEETLQPLADQTGLSVQPYEPHAKSDWLLTLLEMHSGGTVVIAGHSNTIPVLANELLGEATFSQFDDDDYSNLIIIVTDEIGSGQVLRLSF